MLEFFKRKLNSSIVLLTDLEPDDVLAIKLLSTFIPLDTRLYVIIGEGKDVPQKTALGNLIFNKYGFTNYACVNGISSGKDYPERCLKSFGDAKCVEGSFETDEIVKISETENPLLIALKPMRELLEINILILKKFTAFIYGSFNFRCLFKTHTKDQLSSFINNSFKEVYLYESFFASGTSNTMSTTSHPEIFSLVDSDPQLTEIMNGWNEYITKDCLDTVIELSGKLNEEFAKHLPDRDFIRNTMDRLYNRNLKVVQSMADCDGKQFVFADQGLILAMFANDFNLKLWRGDISFNEFGYTQLSSEQNEESCVFTFQK